MAKLVIVILTHNDVISLCNRIEAEHINEVEKLRFRASEAEASSSKLSEQVSTLTKENKTLERKLNQVTNK